MPRLAVAHRAQRLRELALAAEVAHPRLLQLGRARGACDRALRLGFQGLGIHARDCTIGFRERLRRVRRDLRRLGLAHDRGRRRSTSSWPRGGRRARSSSSRSGTAGSRSRWRRRSGGRCSGSTALPRCWRRRGSAAAAAGVDARAAGGRHAGARAGRARGARLLPVPRRCSTCRRGPTGGGCSSGSRPRCSRAGASPGTRSSSTRTSPRRNDGVWADQAGDPAPGRPRARRTTGSTSRSTSADSISLWWADRSEWEGADRRRRAGGRGALRLVRPAAVRRGERGVRLGRAQAGVSLYDSIAELYDPWSRSVTEDVAFYVEEARARRRPGGRARRRHRSDRGADRGGGDPRDRRRLVAGDARGLPAAGRAGGVAELLDLRLGDLRDAAGGGAGARS